jgi:hypothetical protein
MTNSDSFNNGNFYKLLLFSFLLVIITYGFALTNFTISIDNEIPILPDFGLDGGRWGQNLIRYHLFKGHLQYFSLLLSLFLFSLAAVRLAKVFNFIGLTAYLFCGLFLTFPEISYQIVFSMMADVAAFGVLLCVLAIELFEKGIETKKISIKLLSFSIVVLLIVFSVSIYQALIVVPITIYLILFFQRTYLNAFKLKEEIKKLFIFGIIIIVSAFVYYLSVKIICPPKEGAYLATYLSGNNDNQFLNFASIWLKNLVGGYYYGEKLFAVATLFSLFLFVRFFMEKKLVLIRFASLLAILILTFFISYFITNGYHPPRLYVTSNLVFAFIIVFTISKYKIDSFPSTIVFIGLICIINIYFVTNLFYSLNKIYKHDRKIAERIDDIIQSKYPDFATSKKTVYFYGYFPYDYHQRFRIDKSEIFGGSYYVWDNGNNYRIIHFFKDADVAEYNMIDTKEKYNSIKDSVGKMPVWPDFESIKMFNNVVVVKLGKEEGMPIYFE